MNENSSLQDKTASSKPKKFFKNEERSAIRKMKSQSLSALYKSWGTQKKPLLKGKNASAKNKKNTSSDEKLMPTLRTNLSPTPPIPVFNGNFEKLSADVEDKKEAAEKSPEKNHPLHLIDLSSCDEDPGPRNEFVFPHQVGFQVNKL